MEIITTSLEGMLKQFARFRKMYAKVCLPYVSDQNFTPSELDILIFLSNNTTINTSKEVGYYLGVSKGLIARSVERLIKRGLLSVQEDCKDKRILHLLLSEKSGPIICVLKEKRKELDALVMQGIDRVEKIMMEDILTRINDNVERIMKEEDIL